MASVVSRVFFGAAGAIFFVDFCLSKGKIDDFEPQEQPPTHLKSHLFKPLSIPQGPPSLKLGAGLSQTSFWINIIM